MGRWGEEMHYEQKLSYAEKVSQVAYLRITDGILCQKSLSVRCQTLRDFPMSYSSVVDDYISSGGTCLSQVKGASRKALIWICCSSGSLSLKSKVTYFRVQFSESPTHYIYPSTRKHSKIQILIIKHWNNGDKLHSKHIATFNNRIFCIYWVFTPCWVH